MLVEKGNKLWGKVSFFISGCNFPLKAVSDLFLVVTLLHDVFSNDFSPLCDFK